MVAVHFYHLTSSPLERALPKLLEKSYEGGYRTIVLADEARVEKLSELLWTYDPGSFLPHGTAHDGEPARHPIFLTAEMPAQAGEKEILCITNGALVSDVVPYDRVIDLFDGGHEEQRASARARWKIYKEQAISLVYHQQTTTGSWQQKTIA